jgi:hypothetical protein
MILMGVIAALLTITAIMGQGFKSPALHGDAHAIADSSAPELFYYGSAGNMTAAVNATLESYRLASVEQSLVEVCRAIYWMGTNNGCSPLSESFTWSFLFQNGNAGTLNSILGATSSGAFSCSTPAQYGTYLLNNLYTSTDLAGYSYNLNNSAGTGVIGGQADPCAYADIVYRQ